MDETIQTNDLVEIIEPDSTGAISGIKNLAHNPVKIYCSTDARGARRPAKRWEKV